MISSDDPTPLMKQYAELKAQAGDALLLFRMGDFYELFGPDAIEAARILEITLTSRDKNKPNPVPMAGVPHHSVQGYILKLLKAGKKVAISEQFEESAQSQEKSGSSLAKVGPKIVKREIVRMLTPGVQFDLEGAEANYLAIALQIRHHNSPSSRWILACLDASTGEALVSDPLDNDALISEIHSRPIKQVLKLSNDDVFESALPPESVLLEYLPAHYLSAERARAILHEHYDISQLGPFISTEEGVLALGILLHYVLRSQKQDRLAHLRLPEPMHRPKTLLLGPHTPDHLDLDDLYGLINHTKSALGARQLKRWLFSPLKSSVEILDRQKAVQDFSENSSLNGRISSILSEVYDLERISARVNARLANPRDTLALGKSLATLAKLDEVFRSSTTPIKSTSLRETTSRLSALNQKLAPLALRIIHAQKEDAPFTAKDSGVFNLGANPDLDRLISLTENGERWLIELEAREREATGISSLKVRYNRVFGYYIEITQTHLKNVPSHYQRKQTMVGAERFFTEELKKFEEEILTSSSKQRALELELFNDLLTAIQLETPNLMAAAKVLGELDSIASLTFYAQEPGWSWPKIDESRGLHIEQGRHPLVDAAMRGEFVPNDLELSPESQLTLMITGPNMGGKSTVMRQTALIIILGQMGAPIPATSASWGAVGSLYTRIGAHDAIARGQSTFMVEMTELAHILHHADERSFIVLDEIGRGTSTYDGMSVAWAALEWICRKIHARTLFATHYHELTRLEGSLPQLANAHMAVEGDRPANASLNQHYLKFLYLLKKGPASESFGIHVASLAGLPKPVIERAWQVLDDLEASAHDTDHARSLDTHDQLSLFSEAVSEPVPTKTDPVPRILFEELEATNINELTPVQALNFVVKLQEISRGSALKSAAKQIPQQSPDR